MLIKQMDALFDITDCFLTVAKRCFTRSDSDLFPFPEHPEIKLTVGEARLWLRSTSYADLQRNRLERQAPLVQVQRAPKSLDTNADNDKSIN